MALQLLDLSCGYTRTPVVSGVNLLVEAGQFVCLLGANGAGKTSLLKTVAGLLPPLGGQIVVDGKPLAESTPAERAARLAYVPQAHAPLFAFRVLDVVAMGRTARWPFWSGPGRSDWTAAERALASVGMETFAPRRYTELSGGERQMVLLARALAQEARHLVLDEPASSLDFGNQVRVLRCVKRLAAQGFGILMATHHPEHALRCADRVAVLGEGRLNQVGAPESVLTASTLESLYRVPFHISHQTDQEGRSFALCAPCLE